jgi:hypothetical protein
MGIGIQRGLALCRRRVANGFQVAFSMGQQYLRIRAQWCLCKRQVRLESCRVQGVEDIVETRRIFRVAGAGIMGQAVRVGKDGDGHNAC